MAHHRYHRLDAIAGAAFQKDAKVASMWRSYLNGAAVAGETNTDRITIAQTAADSAGAAAAAALDAAPVVVGTMPTLPNALYPADKLVYLSADDGSYKKGLYISTGTTWAKPSVIASQIVDQLIAGQIAAGAIGATEIAAGAITTEKLKIVPQGQNKVLDPGILDTTAWAQISATEFGVAVSDLSGASRVFESNLGAYGTVRSAPIPIDPTRDYALQMSLKRMAGSGGDTNYLLVEWLDYTGAYIDSSVANPTGWSNGTYSYYGVIGAAAPTSWTAYQILFGPTSVNQGGAAIPSNARYVRVGGLLNYNSTAGTRIGLGRLFLTERPSAEIVVVGAGAKIIFSDGTRCLLVGNAFGASSDLLWWFGTVANATSGGVIGPGCTPANALIYIKTDGTSYWGGNVAGGSTAGISVSANPSFVEGAATTLNITTNSTTALPITGRAPFTYSWARVGGDTAWSIGSSTAATTTFTRNGNTVGVIYTEVFRCTVTDADGKTGTVDVDATVERA